MAPTEFGPDALAGATGAGDGVGKRDSAKSIHETAEAQVPIELWSCCTIEPFADGTWQPTPQQPDPDPSKPECILYQLQEADGSLHDVIAWEARNPGIWWLRYGRATFVGERFIDKANRERKPVWLVPTPAEYLKYAPLACCILRCDADVGAILGLARFNWICTNPALWRRAQTAIRERQAKTVELVA